MPAYVNKNVFESADFRSRFLRVYKQLGGVDKACRSLGITTSPLYTYRKQGRDPSPKYNKNRRFIAQMNVIKTNIANKKKKFKNK